MFVADIDLVFTGSNADDVALCQCDRSPTSLFQLLFQMGSQRRNSPERSLLVRVKGLIEM